MPCCGTYLQGGTPNGVDVHDDSTGVYPAHRRNQRPGFLVGSGMGTRLRGFLYAEPGARRQKMAHTGALILRFRGGDRERSSTRRWQLRDSDPTPTPRVSPNINVLPPGRRHPTPWSVWPKARLLWLLGGLGRCRQRRRQPSPPTRRSYAPGKLGRVGHGVGRKTQKDPTRKPRGERGRRTWWWPSICARRAQGFVCGREAPAGRRGR